MQNLQLVQEAAQELYKNKAGQIVALDVQGMTVICDYMLIAAGRTVNQVKALADDVDERMAELGVPIPAVLRRALEILRKSGGEDDGGEQDGDE